VRLRLRIALMRSIVINGQRVKMADARALVEQVGGSDVRSVMATGNLLFRSSKAPRDLERELEAAVAAFYGRSTEMVVKTAEQWRALLAVNPFPDEAATAPSRLLRRRPAFWFGQCALLCPTAVWSSYGGGPRAVSG
jgi:uncharacterized protein (DUF1697 family)